MQQPTAVPNSPPLAVDSGLSQYQLIAFSKQIPILYGILLANALALSATHLHTAPVWLTMAVPGALGVICILRFLYWRRNAAAIFVTDEQARRRLRTTTPLVVVLGVSFTVWSLSLYPYGDAFAKCHVAFYMAITVISCIFCLMHVRRAALLLTGIVIVPYTVFFCWTGEPVLVAIALNLVLVTFGMVFVLSRNYQDFKTMIATQHELITRQAETQRLNDENFHLANIDGLTGLPNRRSFLSQLGAVLTQVRSEGARFAVALVDLDGFKGVNDVHGHATGDRLLAEVGRRLAEIAGPTISAARLGGDEFGVIVTGNPGASEIQAFGQLLCERLRGPYDLLSVVAEVGGSAGLVAYPDGGETAEQLFERADYALYHAKEHGRGRAVIFSQEHEDMIRTLAGIEQAFRHADLTAEIEPRFQPIVDGMTGRTVAFEALARWISPTLGAIAPDVFIPIAERTHLIGALTETVLAKALAAARDWPDNIRVSVNLSARDLASSSTIAAVRRIVAASGVAPGRIDLEITETAVMRDFAQASECLAALRGLGVRVSLDDFGTGFSSLSQIHRLKLDKIKIDRSFVGDIEVSRTSGAIVRTVLDLCRNLDVDCIVEGIETETQRHRLTALGCRTMQGYLFGRPMLASQVAGHMAQPPRAALVAV